MIESTVKRVVSLANEVLKEQMERSEYQVYESGGGGQIFIKAVAALAVGILETNATKDSVTDAVLLADTVLMEQMYASHYLVYESSGGGQIYIMAVATLAAGILRTDAK